MRTKSLITPCDEHNQRHAAHAHPPGWQHPNPAERSHLVVWSAPKLRAPESRRDADDHGPLVAGGLNSGNSPHSGSNSPRVDCIWPQTAEQLAPAITHG